MGQVRYYSPVGSFCSPSSYPSNPSLFFNFFPLHISSLPHVSFLSFLSNLIRFLPFFLFPLHYSPFPSFSLFYFRSFLSFCLFPVFCSLSIFLILILFYSVFFSLFLIHGHPLFSFSFPSSVISVFHHFFPFLLLLSSLIFSPLPFPLNFFSSFLMPFFFIFLLYLPHLIPFFPLSSLSIFPHSFTLPSSLCSSPTSLPPSYFLPLLSTLVLFVTLYSSLSFSSSVFPILLSLFIYLFLPLLANHLSLPHLTPSLFHCDLTHTHPSPYNLPPFLLPSPSLLITTVAKHLGGR